MSHESRPHRMIQALESNAVWGPAAIAATLAVAALGFFAVNNDIVGGLLGAFVLLLLLVAAFGVVGKLRMPAGETDPLPNKREEPQVAESISRERIIVQKSPEDLTAIFHQHLSLQANSLAERFVGKWLRFSGVILDVYPPSGGTFHVVLEGIPLFLIFEEHWLDRASVLDRGESAQGVGRIRKIDSSFVTLEDCELESQASESAAKAQSDSAP